MARWYRHQVLKTFHSAHLIFNINESKHISLVMEMFSLKCLRGTMDLCGFFNQSNYKCAEI